MQEKNLTFFFLFSFLLFNEYIAQSKLGKHRNIHKTLQMLKAPSVNFHTSFALTTTVE